jgi:predicted YcjX-like family ATPase
MAFSFQDMIEEARLSARALIDYGEHFFNPTVRLGVTGLSRAGKTVFITALIHGLIRADRAGASGAAAGRRGAALCL